MPQKEPLSLEEAFDGIPDEIRAAIDSVDWQGKLRRLAGARNFRVDQGATLEDETLRFMTGHQSVEEYAVHLAQELKLPDADFKTLVADLEKEIFMPIQDRIRGALQPEAARSTVAPSSVGEGEEDDLETLLNEGEDAIAKVAAEAPKPVAPAPSVAATPFIPPVEVAPAAAPAPKPVAPTLATAAQKLAEPIAKPVENVVANLQKPKAPALGESPAPTFTPPPAAADPYREAI